MRNQWIIIVLLKRAIEKSRDYIAPSIDTRLLLRVSVVCSRLLIEISDVYSGVRRGPRRYGYLHGVEWVRKAL